MQCHNYVHLVVKQQLHKKSLSSFNGAGTHTVLLSLGSTCSYSKCDKAFVIPAYEL